MFKHVIHRLQEFLWPQSNQLGPTWLINVRFLGRLAYRLSTDLMESQIKLRAMSLVFTTLLAMVPLLAVSFSVLKGFGAHQQIEPFLLQFLQPLGDKAKDISSKFIDFVENARAGVLGPLGLALLFYSAISLVQKVEISFNHIWQLKKSRSFLRRFSDYLSVLLIGPVLIFSAIGVSATLLANTFIQDLLSIEAVGILYKTSVRILPYVLIIAAFTFFFLFIPNTKVKLKPALIGGLFAGLVWQAAAGLFADFVLVSTNYTAIYSGFAVIILFMIWLYLNWLILLLGAALVFYLQNPENLNVKKRSVLLSLIEKEVLGLHILRLIGKYFYQENAAMPMKKLVSQLNMPGSIVSPELDVFIANNLIAESADGQKRYLPACPFENVSVQKALEVIRGKNNLIKSDYEYIDKLIYAIDINIKTSMLEVTLKELALND